METPLSDHDLTSIVQTVEQLTGIIPRADQLEIVRATIRRAMKRAEIDRPAEFIRAIAQDANVYQQLVAEITVGETYFFREPKQFEFIRRQVIPGLRSSRGDSEPLRAWSSACASGEEAFSLAIICDEMSQPAEILATDIASEAIARARRATYRDWSFRGEAMKHVNSYVTRSNDLLSLSDEIRNKVRFQLLNLATDEYPSVENGTDNMDLILCRNVLIYFGTNTINAIAHRLFECLAPGGWLITASGDPPLNRQREFLSITTEYGTFYQRPITMLTGTTTTEAARDEPTGNGSLSSDSAVIKPSSTNQQRRIERASGFAKTPTALRARNLDEKDSKTASEKSARSRQLASAAAAFSSGNYRRTCELTAEMMDHPQACVLQVRAMTHQNVALALEKCAGAVIRHPLSNELHFLHARLLMEANRLGEALQAIQKALFLDRSAVMVHFLFGSIQLQRGQLESAIRHFRNAQDICGQHRPEDRIPFSDDETAAEVAAAIDSQLTNLRTSMG